MEESIKDELATRLMDWLIGFRRKCKKPKWFFHPVLNFQQVLFYDHQWFNRPDRNQQWPKYPRIGLGGEKSIKDWLSTRWLNTTPVVRRDGSRLIKIFCFSVMYEQDWVGEGEKSIKDWVGTPLRGHSMQSNHDCDTHWVGVICTCTATKYKRHL